MNVRKVFEDPRVVMLEEEIAEYTPLMHINERLGNACTELYKWPPYPLSEKH